MNPESGGPERRRHKRARATFIVTYRLRSPIPVRLRTAEQNFTAVAVDISVGGIGVVINEPLPVREPVQISFALLNEIPGEDREMRRWFEMEGKPLHCTLRPKAGYHAGIQFENAAPEDVQFIARFIESSDLKKS